MIPLKTGDKVVPRGPAPVSEVQELARAVNNFAARVATAMEKPDEAPVFQPAPIVSVAPPQVTVNPQVTIERPARYRVTVESREANAQQRIKTLIIEAIP